MEDHDGLLSYFASRGDKTDAEALKRALCDLLFSKLTTAWIAGPFPSSFLLTADHARMIHDTFTCRGILN